MNREQVLFITVFYSTLKQIARFYSAPTQVAVFNSMLQSPGSMGAHFKLNTVLEKIGLGGLSWLIYGVRCAVLFKANRPIFGRILSLDRYSNHRDNIEHVNDISGGVLQPAFVPQVQNTREKFLQFLHFFCVFLPGMVRHIPKTMRIIQSIQRRYGWASAMQSACYMVAFLRFRKLFTQETRAVITACDFGIESLALKSAARIGGLKEIFTMHGQVPSKFSKDWLTDDFYPKLKSDFSFLYGRAALEFYEAVGETSGKIFFTGFRGESKPLRVLPDTIKTVGIAFANYLDDNTLEVLKALSKGYPELRFSLRFHPGMKSKPSLEGYPNMELAPKGESIEEFAARVDCALFGNTGSQLDVLKVGCPIAYLNGLDAFGYDDIGLVQYGVIPEFIPGQHDITLLHEHYKQNTAWAEKFRLYYDALYQADDAAKDALRRDIQVALGTIL
jgi:hypothetical protein